MKRVYALGIIVLALELWAYSVFRSHPLIRPEWFGTLLLVIQLLMSLGGIYASRWLLRSSPVASLGAPRRDWTRLWLWCGPLGGLLLVVACVLGKLAADASGALLAGLIIAAHAAAGAVVWTIAMPWAVADLYSDDTTGFRERLLMQLGIASHVIGFAVYIGFFPGKAIPPLSILGAVFVFGFNLYYIMTVAIVWSVIFRFWKPQPLTPWEEELNHDLDSPQDPMEGVHTPPTPSFEEPGSSDHH